VFVSALTGQGLEVLRGILAKAACDGLLGDQILEPRTDLSGDGHNQEIDVRWSANNDFDPTSVRT
jgi:hypothetical protein